MNFACLLFLALILWSCTTLSDDRPPTAVRDSTRSQKPAGRPTKTDTALLREARIVKGDTFQPEVFLIALSDQVVHANFSGHLTSGARNRNLDFDPLYYTRKIHFFEHRHLAILFFEITNDDGTHNKVYCLTKKDLTVVWAMDLTTPNLSVGQAENDTLYLGAGEHAYALNIQTGHIIWQTDGLYHRYGFNSFDSIALTEHEVHLTGKSFSGTDEGKIKTLVLDKTDGSILRY